MLLGGAVLALGAGRLGFFEMPVIACQCDSQPNAIVAWSEKNLGTITQGQVREVRFTVRNAGRRRLVVAGENRGCCGQPASPLSLVAVPGQSMEIRVKVDTSGWCGPLHQEYSYRTNDPQRPQLTFTILGDVVAPTGEPARS
jgi:hypothetical protein